ncbi:hypothetical protein RQM65_00645 [Pricia sp. S334]|uniref:Uncharacterized protein n=1 Tax=Pricia mediterranea TaxID=3076079 RepID=A0ABU3L1M3_9FLAO|nr:hypothetical protein [Pricia sp. S334]MDT7827168.1 hypothetical protein [Pricia sp. S334]
MATKEIEILNTAIARQEEIGLKIRGWCITLFSAITVAYLSDGFIDLSVGNYLIIVLISTFLFYLIESSHRLSEARAIKRSSSVEQIIRTDVMTYDGPLISQSLTSNPKQVLFEVLTNFRIFPTYIAMIVIAILIFLFSKGICFCEG